LIFCDAEGFTAEKSTLGKAGKPEVNGTIQYLHTKLKIEARLERTDEPITRLLYTDTENNELFWKCHHPKALAEITCNGKFYKGFGYAETLYSGIKPWNLPIGELRWGRYLSASDTLIWISWKGEYLLNKIFLNGIEYNDTVFENGTITFAEGNYQLNFFAIQVIRDGKLSGLFSKMKLVKLLFNNRILNTVETKYKAKATLTRDSAAISDGWSLFEIVKWGN
jgi:hypothetical protein